MEEQSPQLSLDQAETLILSLYQRNPPEVIAATQATLSQFQGSPQAWAMVQGLLDRSDEKVKFFGALTVIIKLNKESSTLSVADANELLARLINWYLDSLLRSDGPLVSRKLSSALATYFLHFHSLWPRFVRHLAVCLASRQSRPLDFVDDTVNVVRNVFNLPSKHIQAALWVVTSVMEDVARIDLNTHKALYDAILQNVTDVVDLMSGCLTAQSCDAASFADCARCFQSWLWFTQRASPGESQIVLSLKPLIDTFIASLAKDDLFDASAELLVDILGNYPSLLNQNHYGLLASLFEAPWAQERHLRLLQGDFDFDSMRFGELLLAFGEAKAETLMQSSSESGQLLLGMLCGLLTANGYPVVEDKIFVPAIEFWSTFSETLADTVHFDQDESLTPWAASAISHVLNAVLNAWHKITYPPSDEFSRWDAAERIGFNDARKDMVDLLQSTFTLVGPRLVSDFAGLVLSALDSSEWHAMEAAAFCLGGLADCGREDARFDEALDSIFASPLFSILQLRDSPVHFRARQTCLSLIEQFAEYFERNIRFLGPALRLLFAMVSEPSMAASASKSVLRLCSSCRHHLNADVNQFLEEYKALACRKQIDCIAAERLLGAIACVAQAVPQPSQRFAACATILDLVQGDIDTALSILSNPMSSSIPCHSLRCSGSFVDEVPSLHAALRALRCLATVGKGFQSPSDQSIDLDGENALTSKLNEDYSPLQDKILGQLLQIEDAFGGSSEVTEFTCSILRSGFSETDQGPFVFCPEAVARFVTSHGEDTRRIGLLVSTACSFVSSMKSHGVTDLLKIVATLLLWVVGLLKQIREPESDPELAQNGLEFASRILATWPASVLGLQPADAAEFLFMFTLRVLDGQEPLPKAAAAEFWTTFVSLRGDDPELQGTFSNAMEALGPLLGQSLARNIGGNASRSELDKLSEPVKKLVSRHTKAREWLQSGLGHASFPSDKISQEQKTLFVKKLIRFDPTPNPFVATGRPATMANGE
ncbi:hypothetical protein HIM_04435 [Hirsutella minnesotensis 3608]|uniref:Exportin-1/Importin-beta-like domain-containing protein n=1 Tax=Hirsutella minnesotensis 3608 TaxID=1043627 RepID=A0A0F8A5V3_9HYPO|nr:hypothetical protein HIM_04435 [Hirsutella minnesotensis 3608]